MAKLLLLSLLVVAMVLSLSDQGDARRPFGRYRRPFRRSPWNRWYGEESGSSEGWESYEDSYSYEEGYYKR